MKKTAVDYRGFCLSNINDPMFSHLKLLFGWVVYFAFYCITEQSIPPESCKPVHMWLDDLIPFCEWFLIPYVFWYGMIAFSLGYFLLYNVDSFKRLQIFFMITQICAVAVYIIFPNRQDLRPAVFPRDNFLTRCIEVLYRIDTNTGVCPSLHVACSVGMGSVWVKQKISKFRKAFAVMSVILICLSTMFIKQHSAVDFFAALPVCLLAEIIVYGKDYWLVKLKR